MTDDVAALVLRDNYFQTQALSVTHRLGSRLLDQEARFIRFLEKSGRLNRAIEFLPSDEEIAERSARGVALTNPERAVLLAYCKMWLFDEIMASDLPEDPWIVTALAALLPGATARALRRLHPAPSAAARDRRHARPQAAWSTASARPSCTACPTSPARGPRRSCGPTSRRARSWATSRSGSRSRRSTTACPTRCSPSCWSRRAGSRPARPPGSCARAGSPSRWRPCSAASRRRSRRCARPQVEAKAYAARPWRLDRRGRARAPGPSHRQQRRPGRRARHQRGRRGRAARRGGGRRGAPGRRRPASASCACASSSRRCRRKATGRPSPRRRSATTWRSSSARSRSPCCRPGEGGALELICWRGGRRATPKRSSARARQLAELADSIRCRRPRDAVGRAARAAQPGVAGAWRVHGPGVGHGVQVFVRKT